MQAEDIVALQDEPAGRPKLVAPLWHTVVLLFLLLVPLSIWPPVKRAIPLLQQSPRFVLYIVQLQWQWILFAVLAIGLIAGGTRLTDLIGGKWNTWQNFFRDLGLGIAVSALNIIVAVVFVLLFRPHFPPDALDPHSMADLLGWIPIAASAGFVEEVACRGYLQKQFHALTGSATTALVLQAGVFSLSHGYHEPVASLMGKFIFGLSFGLVALRRKSLVPGILGHAWQDSLAGVITVLIKS